MNIKDTVKQAIAHGFAPVPRFLDRHSGEWMLRKFINKDTGDYGYPVTHKAWNAEGMPIISLVLRNTLLIDIDSNKDGAEPVQVLQDKVCDALGIDEFDLDEALFQVNEKGDSLHYLFALPASIDFSEIAQSNDGNFIKNVDFKTGRQLVHLKPGKKITWTKFDGLPVIDEDALLKILPMGDVVDESKLEFNSTEETTTYGNAAIRGINERATVFVEEGGRNAALAAAVVATYELVAGGQISESDAEKSINDIVDELGIEDESDTKTTIKFNKEKGLKQPKAPEKKKEVTPIEVTQNITEVETLDDIKIQLQKLANQKMDNLTLDITLKTIQAKYKEIVPNAPTPSITAIKKELNALRDQYNSGDYVENYVFLTATGEYCDRETKAVMGPRSFDVKHNRDTPMIEGEKVSACSYANDAIETVENTMYFPVANDIFSHNGMKYLNAYQPSLLKPIPVGTTNIVDRVKAHIEHLLPNKEEQQIVINYLAHNVQFPGKKLQWAIVLQGVQGDGKSFLSEMMKLVMGGDNVRLMNVQTLESSFTGWATGQCMTFIEELKLDNFRKYEVLNNLKPYISNPVVEETKKGKDPRTVVNTTNYFALTNFKDAIPIDENDRRYCILFSQWQRKADLIKFMQNNPDYYADIYTDMRENTGEILQWLLDHEITDEFKAMKRAPDTQAKSTMMELSKSVEMIAVEYALDRFKDACTFDDGEFIDVTELNRLVKVEADFEEKGSVLEDFPQTKRLRTLLLEVGLEAVGRKRTPFSDGDNKHNIYRF